ncbi:MAG: hypothetical protein ACHQIG_03455 [Acidimicrobiia bacterium]
MSPDEVSERRLLDEALGDGDPVAALVASRDLRDALARGESSLARRALAAGATWEVIGAALGISRQAAWERLRPGVAEQIETERARLAGERERVAREREKKLKGRR